MTTDVRLDRASHTERGPRDTNQDAVLLTDLPDGSLLAAVADGMGGLEAGERASRTALRALRTALERGRTLPTAVREANTAVRSEAEGESTGTTLVAVVLSGDRFRLASVGDSRAYLRGPMGLGQLTRDHTVAAEAKRRGEAVGRELAKSRWGTTLTRSLGGDDEVEVDEAGPFTLGPGGWLLLTSDGVHGVLEDEVLEGILESATDANEAVAALVGRALAGGTQDNVSAVVVHRPGARASSAPPSRRSKRRSRWDPVTIAGRSRNRHGRRPWAVPGILAALAVVALLLAALYILVA